MKHIMFVLTIILLLFIVTACSDAKEKEKKVDEKVEDVQSKITEKAPEDPHKNNEQDENYKTDTVVDIPSVDIENVEKNDEIVHVEIDNNQHPFIQTYESQIHNILRDGSDVISFNMNMDGKTYVVVGVSEQDRESVGGVEIINYQINSDVLTVIYNTDKESEQYVDIVELPAHKGTVIVRGK